jgi:hypothetical protein
MTPSAVPGSFRVLSGEEEGVTRWRADEELSPPISECLALLRLGALNFRGGSGTQAELVARHALGLADG